MQKGNIGVTTENIFPVIKKFLYSDHEIFIREMVSNAVDATQKLKTLANKGEFKGELGELKVSVKVDKDNGTITVSDRGLGMTEEEIDRMMDMTDPDKFALLYDTGHLAYCGQDYLAVLHKYAKRIAHVHLKDIRPEVVEKVKKEKLSFLQGVREGAFTVPGDGCIDFAPVFDVLDKSGYEGWMIVEAEQDPAKANPFEYALKARDYIRKTAKI